MTVGEDMRLRGGSWGADDTLVFGRVNAGLQAVSVAGGEPRVLTTPATGVRHELPEILPGGRAVVFTIFTASAPQLAVFSFDTGETRTLLEGTAARYAESGHLVFGRQGSLWAVPFDLDELTLAGAPVPVRDDVRWTSRYPQFALGAGSLVYVRGSAQSSGLQLVWVDRQGVKEPLPIEPLPAEYVRISPDGSRLAVQETSGGRGLWIYDLERATGSPLTAGQLSTEFPPSWTPDGENVSYSRIVGETNELVMQAADGTGEVTELTKGEGQINSHAFSPDARNVIFSAPKAGDVSDLHLATLDPGGGVGASRTLLETPASEISPQVSPDGRFVVYMSDESGSYEIYVRPFPDVDSGRWQISGHGGVDPVWTRNRREIVYLDGGGTMVAVAVEVESDDGFEPGTPQPLFDIRGYYDSNIFRQWDLTADGERFLMLEEPRGESETPPELILVQNWTEELRRLAPRDR